MKKIISILLVFVFILSALQFIALGDEFKEEVYIYDAKSELLEKLGVTDGISVAMNKALLARMAVGVMLGGNAPSKTSDSEDIRDLAKEPAYGDYISFAVETNLFELNDGMFYPQSSVTKSMLNSIALKLLGYDGLGTQSPDYLVTKLGLYKNVFIKNENNISFREAVGFFYNLLSARVVETTYGNELSFEVGKEDVLSVMFDMDCIYGVIDTPYSKGTTDENCIYVDGNKYKVTESMEKYLNYTGYEADVYVTRDGRDSRVVYADLDAGANKVLVVYADDIIDISDNELNYYNKSSRKDRVSLKSNMTVLYNGHLVLNQAEYFNIPTGKIRFINVGSSNPYALIETYNTLVVGAKTEDDIYDINDPSININMDELETCDIYKDGISVSFDALKKNDVLSIFDSRDMNHIKITASSQTVSGTVDAISRNAISINRKEYQFSQYYLDNYYVNGGDEVTAYLNHEGLITSVIKTNTWNYGYFYALGTGSSGLSAKMQIKMLNANGIFEIYDIADKIDVNGTSADRSSLNGSTDILYKALCTLTYTDSSGILTQKSTRDYVRQVVKYKLNGNNEITKIRTAVISDDYTNDDILRVSAAPNEDYSNVIHYIGGGCFWQVAVGSLSDTKVFDVPMSIDNSFGADGKAETSKRNSVDEKYYRTYDLSTLNGNTKYCLFAYDTSEGGTSACIAINNASAGGNSGIPVESAFVVTEIRRGIYDDRETNIIYGFYNGAMTSYPLHPDFEGVITNCTDINGNTVAVSSMPEKGDIINIALDMDNAITNITMVMKYSQKAFFDALEMYGVEYSILPGWIYSFDDSAITLSSTPDDSGIKKLYNLNTGGRLYIFDMEEDTVYNGSFENLKSYKNTNGDPSFCVGIAKWGRAGTYIIYEGEEANI